MTRPDYYIFGYRIITFNEEEKKKIAQIFVRNNVSVKFEGTSFIVNEKNYKKICDLLRTRVKFESSEKKGFCGFLSRNKKRFGAICALIFTFAVAVFSSAFVWDVRIEGCEQGREEEIYKELSNVGLSVGSLWHKTDKSKVEVALLSNSEYVSWVNINRRGNVAYVQVKDKIQYDEPDVKIGFSNIVAASDGIVEEITVVRGVPLVKAGDTVKTGQLLISGVLPDASGGGFCYAEGTVIAKTNDKVKVNVSKNISVKRQNGSHLKRVSIKILGFETNIFKSYRNFNKEYDIIEKNDCISLFGKKLPISFNREYAEFYVYQNKTLTPREMSEEAILQMKNAISERTSSATLLRVKTSGEYYDGGYTLSSDITLSENIAKNLAFDASVN